MPDARDLISLLFRVTLNRDGQAPALETAALEEGGAEADALPHRRSRRERPLGRPRAIVTESLAQKVLHGWLQNRQQTLYPMVLNFRSLRPPEVELLVHAMAAAATADGQVDEEEQARLTGSLARIGMSEAERRLLAEAVRSPRPLGPLLTDIQRAGIGSHAYAASLLAVNQRNSVNRAYLDYLAARLALPNDVVTSLNRRYRM